MAIKDILVLLDVTGNKTLAAALAAKLAERFDAHLTGLALAVEPVMPPLLVSPVPVDLIAEAQAEAEARAKRAVARFDTLIENMGLEADGAYAAVIAGATAQTIARHCRLTDLVVIAAEDPEKPEPARQQVIEAVLFDAGRPTLLVPASYAGEGRFDKILIAWNGSLPASRAVRAGLPLMKQADSVEVMTIDQSGTVSGATGQDVITYLARHGVAASLVDVGSEGTGVGTTIIAHGEATAADLIVMGGYGHSRLREFILGGATQSLLRAMPVPVLMAH